MIIWSLLVKLNFESPLYPGSNKPDGVCLGCGQVLGRVVGALRSGILLRRHLGKAEFTGLSAASGSMADLGTDLAGN